MSPAEWHWWNYAMVGGGALVMCWSGYYLVRDVCRWAKKWRLPKWGNHHADETGVTHSADANPIQHHWRVSQPTVTVKPPPWSRPILRLQSIRRKRLDKKERRAFKAQIHKLQMEADSIDAARNRHVAWETVQSAAAILDQLSIPHLSSDADPEEWRAFLAHMIVAARTGDIERARAVISDEKLGFMNVSEDFGAPAAGPASPPIGPAGVSQGCANALDKAKENLSNGYHVATQISKCSDIESAREIYELFCGERNATRKCDVCAAFARVLMDHDEKVWAAEVLGEIPYGCGKLERENAYDEFLHRVIGGRNETDA